MPDPLKLKWICLCSKRAGGWVILIAGQLAEDWMTIAALQCCDSTIELEKSIAEHICKLHNNSLGEQTCEQH